MLCAALLASGGAGVYSSYRDTRVLIDELQREKARSAADRIGQFMQAVELQLRGALFVVRTDHVPEIEARHLELVRLLRIAPAISDAVWIDAAGREQIRVSRLGADAVDRDVDRSGDRAVRAARDGGTGFGEISFFRESEPRLEIVVAGKRPADGLLAALVNLKFASDVIADIRVGATGTAYVVDSSGRLIVHPDTGKALRMARLEHVPQVKAALESAGESASIRVTMIARAEGGTWMIAASAPVAPLGWQVIVEQPLQEAFAPMLQSLTRTLVLLLVAIAIAVIVSRALARRMMAPIERLEHGARRIGDGYLEERVEIRTGDELEALAGQFNRMAVRLRESHTDLERKVEERTRQLEEANSAKSRFLAAASHDLRQPVHALGMFVAQLDEVEDEAARRRLLSRVVASSAAVSELIEALLDISKLDMGAVVVQPADLLLQTLFDRVEHMLAPAAAEKGLRLRVRSTRLRVRTDPILLERILLNLCSNAIRYTAQGGVILTARACESGVRLQVWDTGVGISPDQQSRIFDEFYQVPGTSDGGVKGLGLGLAIVRRLAELLDLRVTLRSVQGRGSAFAVDVPMAPVEERDALHLSPLLGTTRFDQLPVLLIDDDPVAREATEGLLRQWGCVVAVASSGPDALQLLSIGEPPRVIICDYHLGQDESGTEVIRRLRARVGREIAAVIVSGDVTQEVSDAASLADVHLFHKPLNAARLRALLLHVAGGDVKDAQQGRAHRVGWHRPA